MLVLPGDLGGLIEFFSFSAWMFYGLAAFSAIVLRIRAKDLYRPYSVPLVIPVFVLVASIYLLVAPIVNKPQMEYLYPLAFAAVGIAVYIPFVQFKYSPQWSSKY